MNPSRRDCLIAGMAMGAVSLASVLAASPRRAPDDARIDLDAVFPVELPRWRAAGAFNAFVRPANQPIYDIYDQVLERTYLFEQGQTLMLSVASYSANTDRLELHRPEICYRYSGFQVHPTRPDDVHAASDAAVPVNRLIAELPGRPEVISYWMTIGGILARDANTFRLLGLSHAVRREVVTAMLVRVSSLDTSPDRAYRLHDDFIRSLRAGLSPERRVVVFGSRSA